MRMIELEDLFGNRIAVTPPQGWDHEACACGAVERTGMMWKVKEVYSGQGK